jgi:hypothetical protein
MSSNVKGRLAWGRAGTVNVRKRRKRRRRRMKNLQRQTDECSRGEQVFLALFSLNPTLSLVILSGVLGREGPVQLAGGVHGSFASLG